MTMNNEGGDVRLGTVRALLVVRCRLFLLEDRSESLLSDSWLADDVVPDVSRESHKVEEELSERTKEIDWFIIDQKLAFLQKTDWRHEESRLATSLKN